MFSFPKFTSCLTLRVLNSDGENARSYRASDSEDVSFQRDQLDVSTLRLEVAAASSAPDGAPSCPSAADCHSVIIMIIIH